MLEANPLDREILEEAMTPLFNFPPRKDRNLPHLVIERYGSITAIGTFGDFTLSIGGEVKFAGYTAERPWLGNARNISCIPAGVYEAKRDTHYGGEGEEDDYEVFELQDVDRRDQIQLHIANFPRQVKGCIAIGRSIAVIRQASAAGELGVSSSRDTFNKLMAKLATYEKITVEIKWRKY
jgi:hypothetical protein